MSVYFELVEYVKFPIKVFLYLLLQYHCAPLEGRAPQSENHRLTLRKMKRFSGAKSEDYSIRTSALEPRAG